MAAVEAPAADVLGARSGLLREEDLRMLRELCGVVLPLQQQEGGGGDSDAAAVASRCCTAVPVRCAQVYAASLYVCGGRATSCDVMCVTNTTRAAVEAVKGKRLEAHWPYTNDNYVKPSVSTKVTPPTALSIKSEAATRARRNKQLLLEHQAFMDRLARSRQERVETETWAATRIQAQVRGHLARPTRRTSCQYLPPSPYAYGECSTSTPTSHLKCRPEMGVERGSCIPHTHTQMRGEEAERDRRMVAELQKILLRAGLPPVPGIDSDGRPLGSSLIERIKRRKRVRRLRAMDNAAATTVQCMVRGKLSRRRVQRARSAKALTQRHAAAKRIQRAWHAYEKRGTWWQGAARQKHDAASAIQAVWRGTAARLHLKQRKRDNMVWQRRCRAAMLLQAFARGFVARRQVATARVQLRAAQHLTARQHSSAVMLQCLARGWVVRKRVALSRAATVAWNAPAFDVPQLEDDEDPAPPYPSGNEDAPRDPGVHSEQQSQRPHPNQEPEG
eukprot:TRINITY_DN5320_c0_g1_i1.p1 TRINITY_DN5320_c0_g1~~TRINITY_DN5320_c0_g1_i1.p1  ORF type:complete len:503 (+),score=52.59 TRINITY_DN5320_c0_g1_i1:29-1537(+)